MNQTLKSSVKRLGKRLIATASLVIASLVVGLSPVTAAPCSSGCVASMSVSPASGTYNPGQTITVNIAVNSSGQSINAAQADFSYTSSRLQYVSGSAAGANGWTLYINSVSSGSGSLVVGRTSGTTTNGSVVTLKFKVLSNTGTATIVLADSSEVNKSDGTGDNILGSKYGASYTIKNASTGGGSSGGGSSSGGTSSGGGTSTSNDGTSSNDEDKDSDSTSTTEKKKSTKKKTEETEKEAEPQTPPAESIDETPVPIETTSDKINPALVAAGVGVPVIAAAGVGTVYLKRRRLWFFEPKPMSASDNPMYWKPPSTQTTPAPNQFDQPPANQDVQPNQPNPESDSPTQDTSDRDAQQ